MESLQPVNLVDGIAVLVLLAGMALGLHRGLSGELARLLSVMAAFVVAWLAYRPLGLWLLEHTRLQDQAAQAVGFALAVVPALVGMVLLRLLLKPLIKVVFHGAVDKVGGIAAGFARSALLIAIVFMMVNTWPHEYLNEQFGEASLIGRLVLAYGPRVRRSLEDMPVTDAVRDKLRESREQIETSVREGLEAEAREQVEAEAESGGWLRRFSREE